MIELRLNEAEELLYVYNNVMNIEDDGVVGGGRKVSHNLTLHITSITT